MTLASSVRLPPTDADVDTGTWKHGPFQLLLKYGPHPCRLTKPWEYWAPSYLRRYHHRSLHVQMPNETRRPCLAKAVTRRGIQTLGTTNPLSDVKHLLTRCVQVGEFFKSSGFQMQSLHEHRIMLTTSLNASNLPNSPPVLLAIERITRHVRAFAKFFRRLQQLDTKRFVLLPICTDVVLYYWNGVVRSTEVSPELINGTRPITNNDLLIHAEFFTDTPYAVFPVRMLVQAMVLFRESLKEWTPVRRDGTANEHGTRLLGHFAKQLTMYTVLSGEFVEGAVRLLVTRFIPLTPKDLERWELDVEEWMNEEENEDEQWEYGLRVRVPSLVRRFLFD